MRQANLARWRTVALGAVVLGSAAWAGEVSPTGGGHGPTVSDHLRQRAKQDPRATLDVIIRFRQQPGDAERNLLGSLGIHVRRQIRSSRWMAARLSGSAVAALGANPAVDYVATDAPMSPNMDLARQAAQEPALGAPESTLKGAGVTIAMLDSGVAQHPDLKSLVAVVDFTVSGSPKLGPSQSTSSTSYVPAYAPAASVDGYGHGTHVAGIMVGNGSTSAQGGLAGIAPEASLVSVRVLDDSGRGQASDVLAGLQWVLDNKDALGIRVLNLSLGHPVYEPAERDPLVQQVEALWSAGVVVVCSAGNAGRLGDGTITSPCNSRAVISVGALNDHNTPETTDDTAATYSSRGPTRGDLVAKPDLLAPGNRIVSTRAAGSYLDNLFPERRVAGDPAQPEVLEYLEMSGTSMAAPMVAGTVALMLEQEPWLNPGTVKARLMLSAHKAELGNPFASGAGALDILAALRVRGDVADAPSPLVLPDSAAGQLGVENTAVLWGNPAFPLDAIWPMSVQWSTASAAGDPLWWSPAVLWPNADLWPEANLWPEADLWPETILWGENVLWSDEPDTPMDIDPLAILVPDP